MADNELKVVTAAALEAAALPIAFQDKAQFSQLLPSIIAEWHGQRLGDIDLKAVTAIVDLTHKPAIKSGVVTATGTPFPTRGGSSFSSIDEEDEDF